MQLRISSTPPVAVHVDVAGEGPPVVLLHGFPGSGRSWDRVASALSATHTVVVPDLLGFGRSSRPRELSELRADAQARAVLAALDALGIERAALVGHDFGGPVALSLLAARPERVTHLALSATNAFPDTPVPFPLSLLSVPLVGRIAPHVLFCTPSLRAMVTRGVGRPRVRLDAASHVGDRSQARATKAIFRDALTNLAARYGPLADVLPTIAVPSLVAWGDRDPFFPVAQGARTAGAIPGARFVVYEGAGHFVPEERPDELVEDLRALLATASVA
jgi:pimeloyl-ACP methyl ester carboxylesterase